MADELIDIYDRDRNLIGQAIKSQAHNEGLWHKVFHCWIIKKEDDGNHKVWLQLRDPKRDLQPNTMDASSSGHVHAGEKSKISGIRKIYEELGLSTEDKDLSKMFSHVFADALDRMINREFAAVYMMETDKELKDITMQEDEVYGLFEANYKDLVSLFNDQKHSIKIKGFIQNQHEKKEETKNISIQDFFMHDSEYYVKAFNMIKRYLEH